MKPDWFSRTLLLIILVIVCYLAFRPQPGRYRVQQLPYVFDTATGRLVMLSADESVKEHWKKLDAEEKAEKEKNEQENEQRLAKECPPILLEGSRKNSPNRSFEQVLDDAFHEVDLKECQDWKARR